MSRLPNQIATNSRQSTAADLRFRDSRAGSIFRKRSCKSQPCRGSLHPPAERAASRPPANNQGLDQKTMDRRAALLARKHRKVPLRQPLLQYLIHQLRLNRRVRLASRPKPTDENMLSPSLDLDRRTRLVREIRQARKRRLIQRARPIRRVWLIRSNFIPKSSLISKNSLVRKKNRRRIHSRKRQSTATSPALRACAKIISHSCWSQGLIPRLVCCAC